MHQLAIQAAHVAESCAASFSRDRVRDGADTASAHSSAHMLASVGCDPSVATAVAHALACTQHSPDIPGPLSLSPLPASGEPSVGKADSIRTHWNALLVEPHGAIAGQDQRAASHSRFVRPVVRFVESLGLPHGLVVDELPQSSLLLPASAESTSSVDHSSPVVARSGITLGIVRIEHHSFRASMPGLLWPCLYSRIRPTGISQLHVEYF
jgi:hypothetical protein